MKELHYIYGVYKVIYGVCKVKQGPPLAPKMAEEEEVVAEVEAVQAVYGDDCLLLNTYPPSFHLHIKPRTADDSSQQVLSFSQFKLLVFLFIIFLITVMLRLVFAHLD